MMKDYTKDNETGTNHEGAHPNRPLRFLTATSIMGDKVTNSKGEHMGHIKDLMIDLSDSKVEYVVLELGGFLGIGEKLFAIPFFLLKVDAKHKSFILDQKHDTLKNAPGFNEDHWPETNSHAFSDSTSYWTSYYGG